MWDIVLTIVLLVIGLLSGVFAFFAEFFIAAFTDSCPPATCHLNAAAASLGITWLVIAVVLILCTVFAIIRMVRRRLAWWLGLIAIFAVILGSVIGFTLYSVNVGYT